MAEERTLGLARVQEPSVEPSKEELQRRLDHTRDSISQTVTEIKETVANEAQAVKNTLDWREQFKKRPVAWSAGAIGVGFLVGYGVGSAFKGDDEYQRYSSAIERYGDESRSYAAQPILGTSHGEMGVPSMAPRAGNGSKDHGPGFFQKVANTHAFERVVDEAGNIGNAFVQELSNTAKTVVLPALITSLRNFIGGHLPNAPKSESKYQPTRDQ